MDEPIEPSEVLADRSLALEVLEQDGLALEFTTDELRDDREIVLLAVQNHGLALRFASEGLKDDEEVAVAAVKQTGYALQHVSARLRGSRAVVFAALRQSGYALKWVDAGLWMDEDIVLLAERHAPSPEGLSRFPEFQCIVEEQRFKDAVASSIAAEGELAPEASVMLSLAPREGDDDKESTAAAAAAAAAAASRQILCEVSLSSGQSFTLNMPEDGGAGGAGPTWNDLANQLVEALPKHSPAEATGSARIHIALSRSEADGGPLTVKPRAWDQHLAEFC